MLAALRSGDTVATARLSHLSYWYPGSAHAALDDVSLVLEGMTLVAGRSGGGKSSLLRVLNGLVPHFHGGRIAGHAEVEGLDVIGTPTRSLASTVGFVFQDPELQAVYDSVEREVAFGLENIGIATLAMASRVDDALAEAGAQHLVGRRIRSLSGGERQRVALAAVLAMQPRLVVLDEPTSQLDPEGASLVLTSASRLRKAGRTLVISEHRLEQLVRSADRVVSVEKGRVQAHAPSDWRTAVVAVNVPRTSAPGPEAWSLNGVTAGFSGQPVLEGVTLGGNAGEILALTGPNGGGKTTLLRTISGVLPPLVGAVERRPGRVAYLPQNPAALLHRPTVRSEVELTLSRAEDAAESPDLILDALGLREVAGRYPRDLSSGERQRAALAAVLPGRPSLVLLDEPTRGMDAAAREALIRLVARLRDAGSSVVLATHDVHLRQALGDRVVRVCGGKVGEL